MATMYILTRSRMIIIIDPGTFPHNWDEMAEEEDVKVVVLDPCSEEYENVCGKFLLTLPMQEVVKIYRIQNKILWNKYCDCSRRMERYNDGILKEEVLFHGTRGNKPELIYKGDAGFDMRFSANGMWGKGNYFAKNSSYSNGFAYHGKGLRKMFAAWVLTGISHESPPKDYKMPPYRPQNDSAGHKIEHRCDSVTGTTGGTRVYITYDNDHAYPAYLIVYK